MRRLSALAQAEFRNISIMQGGAVGGGGAGVGVGERRKCRRGVGGEIGHDGGEGRGGKRKKEQENMYSGLSGTGEAGRSRM